MPEVELSYTYDVSFSCNALPTCLTFFLTPIFPPFCETQLPWETVVRAYLSRYPKHEKIPMMLAQELTRVAWTAETKVLVVDRRMQADLDCPSWLKRLFGVYFVYMWQTVTIDVPARRMVSVSSSNPQSTLYKAWETATWQPDAADPAHRTVFSVRSGLQLEPFFLNVQSVIENFLLRQFRGQFDNARKVDHAFIDLLRAADSSRTDAPTPETLLDEAFAAWIARSLAEQKAPNIADICPAVFGPESWSHTIEIGPCQGKQL